MTTVFFSTTNPNIVAPTKATPGSAAYDLRATISYTLAAGARAAIPTGLMIQLPLNHVGLVCPRSGLAINHGITVLNAPGVIDSDYYKEIKVILINESNTPYDIQVNDRIAQLLIVKAEDVTFTKAEIIDATERRGGFGSTGR